MIDSVRKRMDVCCRQTINLVYSFEPLKIVTPDLAHKVNEAELQKSIQKSKELVAVIEEYKC